jgi:hypothetical protein
MIEPGPTLSYAETYVNRRPRARLHPQPTGATRVNSTAKFGEAVKPLLHRYILAHTAGVSAGIGVIGALALMLAGLHSEGALIPHAGVLLWIALAAVPVAAIGWIVGIIFLWGMMLGHIAARLQGWPFAVGDRVWILTGRHKNTIATVYEVWTERGQVRVELGAELKKKIEDVYCAVAVCRARNTQPDGAANGSQQIRSETNQT